MIAVGQAAVAALGMANLGEAFAFSEARGCE